MSYDFGLRNRKKDDEYEYYEMKNFQNADYGGTILMGGQKVEAKFNMTYNYSCVLSKVIGKEGIRTLYGKNVNQCIDILDTAMENLLDWIRADKKEGIRSANYDYCRKKETPPEELDYWSTTLTNVFKNIKYIRDFLKDVECDMELSGDYGVLCDTYIMYGD